jgi:2-polyprenyl-6-methoxyphenol hydroxylase-like FAD-dependent oxidoreductase
LDIDVAIIGAGPAGAAAGLALGGRARVLLIDRVAEPAPRIGESLIPAARRLLSDLGVLKAFEAEPHPPYLGNRSVWGGDWAETDFLRDPDGAGWHLDRVRFETFLRKAAGARGCRIIAPAKLETIAARGAGGWDIAVTDGRDRLEIEAKVVIDATGRAATVAKRLGAARKNSDRLTARWIRGQTSGETSRTAGFSTVESEAEGWWYTAPLADGTRVLAFHTDTDLMSETETVSADGLVARAMRCPAGRCVGRNLDHSRQHRPHGSAGRGRPADTIRLAGGWRCGAQPGPAFVARDLQCAVHRCQRRHDRSPDAGGSCRRRARSHRRS